MEPVDDYHPEDQKRFINKWSEDIERAGYTMIPNLLLRNTHKLRITPSEFLVLVNIESFRWNVRPSHPSIQRLAMITGMSERHVTRLISSLEYKDILERNKRRNRTNEYDIYPLVIELDEMAIRENDEDDTPNEKDDIDTTSRQGGQFDTDNIVQARATSLSAKEEAVKEDEVKKKSKKILAQKIVKVESPEIDLSTIEF